MAGAVACGIAGSIRADGPVSAGVVDTDGLFRASTIERADATIAELRRKYQFDVRVETLQLPESERVSVGLLPSRRAQARYFADLGRQRAEAEGVNGISILICTAPPFVDVTVYPRSAESLFSRYQQRQLTRLLQSRFDGVRPHEERFAAAAAIGFAWQATPTGSDAALNEVLSRIESVLRTQAGDPNSVRSLALVTTLAGGVAVWAVLALASRRISVRQPGDPLASPQPSNTPAMLAARFGTPTGCWAYDRLFASPPPQPAPPSIASVPPAAQPGDPTTASAVSHDQPV
jgi:hypothetical protein